MTDSPLVRARIKTVIEVTDDLGTFEFDCHESSDTEILRGLSELIDHCWDVITERDSTRYAVFALLTNYFNLEQTRDGRGDRLTTALFTGIYKE